MRKVMASSALGPGAGLAFLTAGGPEPGAGPEPGRKAADANPYPKRPET